MNIFLRELRTILKSLIIWCICAVMLIAGGMAKYSALSADDIQINKLLMKMPKAIQILIGGGAFDLTTIGGYYGIIYQYLLLIAAVYALTLGVSAISREERNKTVEFLMTKPMPRYTILSIKLLTALICTFLFTLIIFVTSIVSIRMLESNAELTGPIIRLCTALLLIQCIFMSIGAVLAGYSKNSRKASSIGMIILFSSFFLWIAMGFTDNLSILKPLTPFNYFDAAAIINGSTLDMLWVLVSVIIFIVLSIASLIGYQKRDLKP